ncbi:hypothetical protein GCM10009808_15450 [Microbacterium sediminicola]|uniref:Uncharacterized protein n=1 Tax=Microbacterium sediminicola TaxID=415210 RepID=A0ABP4U7P5_9MICO
MTTCFVIGPIGNELAPLDSPERLAWESALEIYDRVIQTACSFLDIEAVRADQISITGDINEQIFRHLFEADLVIADLSGANANVMYELGLRHSLNKLTIQVADAATPLPFDVKAVRTILIQRSQMGLVDARKKLVKAIEVGLSGASDMVAATRVWSALEGAAGADLDVILGEPDAVDGPEDLDEADGEGFVEIMVGLEGSFQKVTHSLEKIGSAMRDMNDDTSQATAEMNHQDKSLPSAARMGLIHKFAGTLKGHGEILDALTLTYEEDVRELDSRVSPLLRMLAGNEQLREMEGADRFLDMILGLAASARGASEGFSGFSSSLQFLGTMSSLLRSPSKLISRGVARIADSVTLIDDWDAAARRVKALGEAKRPPV